MFSDSQRGQLVFNMARETWPGMALRADPHRLHRSSEAKLPKPPDGHLTDFIEGDFLFNGFAAGISAEGNDSSKIAD